MKFNLYSVRDAKVGFAAPFMDSNDDSAIRGFSFAFANQANLYSFAASDFALYRVGAFDSISGSLEVIVPVFVCDASSFVKTPGGVVVEE